MQQNQNLDHMIKKELPTNYKCGINLQNYLFHVQNRKIIYEKETNLIITKELEFGLKPTTGTKELVLFVAKPTITKWIIIICLLLIN